MYRFDVGFEGGLLGIDVAFVGLSVSLTLL